MPHGASWPLTYGVRTGCHDHRRTACHAAANGEHSRTGHWSEVSTHGRGRETPRLFSGRAGHSRSGEAAGAVRAQRDRRTQDQPTAEVPRLLLGSDPVDDRDRRDFVGRGRALAGLLHHPAAAGGQRCRRLHRGAPGGQRDRRPEGQAGDQCPRHPRRRVDQPTGAGVGAR